MTTEHDLAKAIADAVDAKVASMRPESSTMPATYQGRDSEGKGWVLLPGATEPTPVARMAVEAAQGDTVSVTVANGKATVNSNLSNPSAGLAGVQVVERTANTASATASEALAAASDARTAATSAQASADTARQAATDATLDAATARSMAESATADAAIASASATVAKESADKATYALSDVENVVGTLNWIAEHGEYVLTSDTAIVEGKAYYTRNVDYAQTSDTIAQSGKTYYTRSGTSPDYVYTAVALPDSSSISTENYHITVHPHSNIMPRYGGTATFTVETNDTPELFYWHYSADGGTTWKQASTVGYSGYDTDTLSFEAIQTRVDGRLYRCYVRFSDSTHEYSGSSIVLIGTYYEELEVTYTLVTDPQVAELSSYYELSLNESVQNYLASHLWLDDYGLNLSVDSANGYRIHQGTVDGTKTAGTYILDPQGAIVASFGMSGFQVGLDDESHLVGDYHSLQLLDKEGSTYFHVSDLRDADGSATFVDRFIGDNTTRTYTVGMVPDEVVSVTVGGEAKPYTQDGQMFTFNQVITTGQVVVITYKSSDPTTKAYTFGKRYSGSTLGALSVAEGLDTKATFPYSHAEGWKTAAEGRASHAEGYLTTASGYSTHAEGSGTTASGNYSHAEGSGSNAKAHYSHVEGNSTVYPGAIYAHAEGVSTCAMDAAYSHAEGYSTHAGENYAHAEGGGAKANGAYSHAQNRYTLASSTSQTALGMYNVEDANDVYAVIIGNGVGTSSSQRSNALTTDWDGIVGAQNVGMYGTCDTAAATADKVATLDDYGVTFKLVKGAVVRIYMANSNTVADPTLNVNGTGAKAIKRYGNTAPGTASGSSWIGGTVMTFLYAGTYWRLCDYRNNDNTVPSAYCSTAAATAAKVASCSGYALLSKSFLHVILTASNTAASALTFNVNGKGAKPIYINGTASSSSNYTLPAGSYLVYYNGTNYYFRTDGLLTASVTGTASNVTGTVAIAHGGTGDTATTTTTTLSEICTKGTNITLSSGSYSHWGKVASFSIAFKPTAAIASGATVFTMVSGKRPDLYSIGNDSSSTTPCSINTDGTVICRRALTSGTTYTFRATYLLA